MVTAASTPRLRRLVFAATLLPLGAAQAATWTVEPVVTLTETWSDNLQLTADAPLSGWITDVAPGIHIEGTGARLKAKLDYGRHFLRYSGHSELNQDQNALASSLNYEALEKWLYLDASADIVQRTRNAFDVTPLDPSSASRNRVETTTLRVSPYVKGAYSDLAAYIVRYTASRASTDDDTVPTTRVNEWSANLRNASAGARIGWSLDGDAASVRNAVIGDRSNVRVRAGLNYEILPDLHVSVSGGRERTDFASTGLQNTWTPGLGLQWTPSPRTLFAAQAERRFFGTARAVQFRHRMSMIEWRYNETRDVAILPSLLSATSQGAITELLADLLAASVQDPTARETAVRERLNRYGTFSNQSADADALTARLLLDHSREASVAAIGPRDTLTFSLVQREQQALTDAPGILDAFALSNNQRERRGTVSWFHRLTPLATLNLSYSRSRREGLSNDGLSADEWAPSAVLSLRMGPKTFLSFGLRTVRFDSAQNGSFRERAAAISLTQRF
ncbi:TIGR03016 family PEP-CTERM system-associated outer membrane protein [Oxalobacteraceae bacterium OM1]|nr:TIGR03016 family PEP-CTERM system-associated outer membrane protein [Oxalobacteraceae bacterium OM1]